MIYLNSRNLIMLAIVVGFLSLPVNGQPKTVRTAIPAQNLTALAFYVAQEKGYYRAEGLDVQLILMSAPVSAVALIGGDLEFSTAAGAAMTAAVRGAPLSFLFHTYYLPLYWLYVRPEILNVAALKGRKIGVSGIGSGPYFLVLELLKKHGLEAGRDVAILTTGVQSASFAALASGVVDATSLSPPFMFKAQQAGFRELVAFVKEDFVELQSAVVVRNEFLKTDSDLVEKFLRGTVKGLLYARQVRSGTVPIVARLLKIDAETAAKTYDLYRSAMTSDGTVSKEIQARFMNEIAKRMKLKESPAVENIFNYSTSRKINREIESSGWKPGP
jgi:ABC-type nitrate/sulfonate/bicarbonate transport system substrate-binding protein